MSLSMSGKQPKSVKKLKRQISRFIKPDDWVGIKKTHWQKMYDDNDDDLNIDSINEIHCIEMNSFVADEIKRTLAQSMLMYRILMQRNANFIESINQSDDLYYKRTKDVMKFVDIYNRFIKSDVPWDLVEYKFKSFDGRKRINCYKIYDTMISLNDLCIRNCENDWWVHGSDNELYVGDPLRRKQETSYMQGFCDEYMNIYLAIISFAPNNNDCGKRQMEYPMKCCDPCIKCSDKYFKCGAYNLQCNGCPAIGTIDDWCIKCHGEINQGYIRQCVHEKEAKLIDRQKLFERAMDPLSHTVIHFFHLNKKNQDHALIDSIDSLSIK